MLIARACGPTIVYIELLSSIINKTLGTHHIQLTSVL